MKVNKSELIYEGKIIKMFVDSITLDNEEVVQREIVETPDSVGIIALTPNKKLVLVKQYRHAMQRDFLELPAGLIDEGEQPLVSIQRELLEETGYLAKNIHFVAKLSGSPGTNRTNFHLYYAVDVLKVAEQALDEDEFIEVVLLGQSEVEQLIRSGKINDMKTLLAYYYLQYHGLF